MFTRKTKSALIKGIITKRTPIYVQYAVTKRCNLGCRMCGSSVSRKEERELDLPEIKKLAEILDRLNIGVIVLTGGEPFVRDDLPEIVFAFSQKGLTVRLQTNGILATEEKIRAVYQAGLKEVTLSLESMIPEVQDAITGQKGSWHQIMEAIARFSQILPGQDTILGVNTVVCKQNLREIPRIIKFVTKIGFYSSLIPVHLSLVDRDEFIIRKKSPECAFDKESFDELDQIYEKVIQMKKERYHIYNSYKFLRNSPKFLKGEKINWHCDSPDLYFAISPSGNFLPCVDIKTATSILQDDFVNLYHSQIFRRKIKEEVRKCPGCFYACWPEVTFLCRDPLVLVEKVLLGIKTTFKKRKSVTYRECLEMVDRKW